MFDAFDANSLAKSIESALRTFRDGAQWRRPQQNGMGTDYSWERQILEYVELYKKLPAM